MSGAGHAPLKSISILNKKDEATMSGDDWARYPSLSGRPVVVSGGATGIGEALVRHFAGQGAKVGFTDIAADAGAALEAELADAGATVTFAACDVTDIPAYTEAIEGIAARQGAAHVLVNNAANDTRHDWDRTEEADWDRLTAVNLKHYFFAIKAVAPAMIGAGGGSIINFGSISWMIGGRGMPVYMTAKSAVHGLTRSFAKELGGHEIRVNTLVPGAVMTPRQLELWISEDDKKNILAAQSIPRLVKADDVARMALFLAADDSCLISGQDFLVDGGWAHG